MQDSFFTLFRQYYRKRKSPSIDVRGGFLLMCISHLLSRGGIGVLSVLAFPKIGITAGGTAPDLHRTCTLSFLLYSVVLIR
jgi:hypothetical protein